MAVTIQQEQLTQWKSFFEHNDVQADFALNPTTAGTSAGSAGLSCVNKRFENLKFDSAANKERFGKDEGSTGGSTAMGLPKSNSASSSRPLSQILSQAGVTDVQRQKQNLFNQVIDLLGTGLKFVVDQNEKRNAMWLTPGQTMRLDTALSFVPDPSASNGLEKISQAIRDELGFKHLDSIKLPSIIVQRTNNGVRGMLKKVNDPTRVPSWRVTTTFRLTFRIATDNFVFWISLEPLGMGLSITKNPDADLSTDAFWSKIDQQKADGLNSSLAKPVTDFFAKDVQLLMLSIGRDTKQKIWWKVTVAVNVQQADSKNSAVDLYLTYNSLSSTFAGGLILSGFYTTDDDKFSPDYEAGREIDLPAGKQYSRFWDLKQLFSNPASVPDGLPTAIAAASVSFQNSAPKKLSFSALAINPPQPATTTKVLPSPFVWDELDVYFSKGEEGFECSLSAHFTLNPPPRTDYLPADLGLSFEYDKSGWTLSGYAENLSCGLLYSFFEDSSKDALLDVLGKLNLASLDMLWTHDSTGAAASFLFTGVITLGELQLRLFYQYASSNAGQNKAIADALKKKGGPKVITASGSTPQGAPKTTWFFECDLGASNGKATIGSIADSISEDAAGNLPSFIASIKIPEADGNQSRAPISLKATKNAQGNVLFVFRFTLDAFTFTFVQVADGKKQKPTKRLLRFAVDKIPMKENIPLLNRLPQPFDRLEYVWVNAAGGFLKSEVDALNDPEFLTGEDTLMYKNVAKTQASKDSPGSATRPPPNADPVVLTPGHHFIVVHDGKVAIDHLFFASPAPKPTPTPNPGALAVATTTLAATITPAAATGPNDTSKPPQPSAPAKGALSFKLGPLAIDAVSLQFKEQAGKKSLSIVMDATFTMGPITFGLLGFGIVVTLSEGITLDRLKDAVDDVDVILAGLALAFNKPPLLIAGGFEHAKITSGNETQDIYLGGVGVSFPPYTFVGIGEYAVVDLGGKKYKSVFLFSKLDGPLITLQFSTISGVRLGLGYNSIVRSPTIDELGDFPFINDRSLEGSGNDPMKMLKAMTATKGLTPAWVSPKPDSYWFAAGMSITAFSILEVTAVAMLAFRDSGLVASIYANAIAKMPPDVPKEAVIVYAEIDMVAEMNFVDGYFRVEAALSPTSYLLVPQCKIYGGFALCYWFPVSACRIIMRAVRASNITLAQFPRWRLRLHNRRLSSKLHSACLVSETSTPGYILLDRYTPRYG